MDDRFAFDFVGERWLATPEGALVWPRRRVLLVADLHLEKASWFAAHGQPLPPYDSRATLDQLSRVVARYDPAEIWCLGDSFHDPAGQDRLDPAAEALLTRLAAAHRWLFLAGNHDGLLDGRWGSRATDEVAEAGIVFRHAHDTDDPTPQISGHYHPKVGVSARGRMVRRPCFLLAERALILPAFGSFTGGLDIHDAVFAALLPGPRTALVATGQGLARFAQPYVAKMSQDCHELANLRSLALD
jgi:hypothetical protein